MDKVVVITGATDGIGRALALLLAKEYKLALCGRSKEKMNSLLEEISAQGDFVVYADCFDLTDDEKREHFCKNVVEEFGTVDIVVNNAGANTKKDKVAEICLDDLRYMFELNCVSTLGVIQQFYPVMAEKKSGLFVNILSTCCLYNNPMTGSYSAAKDAMGGLTRILLKEAKADGIGVCSVYPGGVDTNFRANANTSYLRPDTIAKMIKVCMENEDGCVHDIVIRPDIETNMA